MSKVLLNQAQFNGGVFSPRLYGRVDVDKYEAGLKESTNAYATKQGPILRRQGSKFRSYVKSDTTTRLVNFSFSKDDSFILECGVGYIRFYDDSGQLTESSKTITNITQASTAVVTVSGHGYSNGDYVYITSAGTMTEVVDLNKPYIVQNVTTNTFELFTSDTTSVAVNSTGFTTFTGSGSVERIYEISSPYSSTDLDALTWAQFGDSIYFASPLKSPRVLTRGSSNLDWSIEELSLSPPPLYETGSDLGLRTLAASATTGSVIITATTIGSPAYGFVEADVGRQIRGNGGVATITGYISSSQVNATVIEDFTDTSSTLLWSLDLSPLCDIEWQGTAEGSIVTVVARKSAGSLGPEYPIAGITNTNPATVTTSSVHGLVPGDRAVLKDIVGMTELNNVTFRAAAGTAGASLVLANENTTSYNVYSSGGIVQKVLEDERIVAFSGYWSASLTNKHYIVANGGVLQILSAGSSGTEVECLVVKSPSTSARTSNWSMQLDTWGFSRGYPRAVTIHQERLVFGGTDTIPQGVWMSEINKFNSFGIGPESADAIDITLGSNTGNRISWLGGSRELIVGTAGGELTINGGSTGTSITPSTASQQPRTSYGSEQQQPLVIGSELFFTQQAGRKIRTFRFEFDVDTYLGEDITVLADDITKSGIVRLAYSQEPDNLIYAVLTNGTIAVCTYERSQNVIGWTTQVTDGDYLDIQTIPQGELDQVWVIVQREVDGTSRKYIESFEAGDSDSDLTYYADCALALSNPVTISSITKGPTTTINATSHGLSVNDEITIKQIEDISEALRDPTKTNLSDLNGGNYKVGTVVDSNSFTILLPDGGAVDTSNYNDAKASTGNTYKKVTSISGLGHLEGKTVTIKGDGSPQPVKVVENGSIDLSRAAGEVVVGLPYTTTITTLPKNFQLSEGQMSGQRMRAIKPILHLYKSTLPTLNGEYLPSRVSSDKLGNSIPLFSGNKTYGPIPWNNTGELTLKVDSPLPLQLTAIYGAWEGGVP